MSALIECVPNFSEGRDPELVRQVPAPIESVEGVTLLHVDPGEATNRTVVTFAGPPEPVVEAAFRAIAAAALLIDMTRHHGEHPRMGATDVCPLVPVSGITLEETAGYARRLAERVARELSIPVYLYEAAQPDPARRNLAHIRAGEYEGLPRKLADPAAPQKRGGSGSPGASWSASCPSGRCSTRGGIFSRSSSGPSASPRRSWSRSRSGRSASPSSSHSFPRSGSSNTDSTTPPNARSPGSPCSGSWTRPPPNRWPPGAAPPPRWPGRSGPRPAPWRPTSRP